MRIKFLISLFTYLGTVLFSGMTEAQDSLSFKIPESYQKDRINALFSAGPFIYVDALTLLNYYHWHSEDIRSSFHFFNDYNEYLQVDKFKHAYGSYFEGYVAYNLMRSYGIKRNTALIFGGAAGFVIQTPKEFFDGIYKSSGFSWSDVVANALGSSLFVGQELLFKEQLLKFKFSFSRSEYTRIANGYLGDNLIENYFVDYNGHTYWFTMNANKILLKNLIPGWIDLAIGYGANGMIGRFQNIDTYHGVQIPYTPRYRQFLFSLDVDWTHIKTRSKAMKILFQGLNFIKIPFPAIEFNSRGKFKGYWIYF